MSKRKPRINVTYDFESAQILSTLAKQKKTSISSLVRDLTLEALELQEDMALSRIAEKLDTPGAKRVSHEDVWN